MFTQPVVIAHAHLAADRGLVVVGGTVNLDTCIAISPLVHDAIDHGATIVDLDIRDVSAIDAQAVRAVRRLRDETEARGSRLRLIGADLKARRLLGAEDASDLLRDDADPAAEVPRPDLSCCTVTTVADPIADLLREAYALPPDDPRREQLRRDAIELGIQPARRLAKRFSGRGEPAEDLAQVAAMGLIHAVDRYDPSEPAGFWPYAAPTIVGELRKHFRDKGWSIRVPRRLQDVWLQIRGEADGLTQRLGRPVTGADLAEMLDLDESLIEEARLASRSYAPMSLWAPVLDSSVLADHIAVHEEGYDHVDNEQTVRQALRALPKRARHIVGLRFRHEMSQAQIAAAVGLSQMHVSRILADAVATLRDLMTLDDVGHARRDAVVHRRVAGGAAPRRSGVRPSRTRISPTTTP